MFTLYILLTNLDLSQVYELYNAGDVEGSYVIDTSTLEDLRVVYNL